MEEIVHDASEIVDGILAEVDEKVSSIISQAESYAKEKNKAASEQSQAILNEAESKAKNQAEMILAEAESKLVLEKRRHVFLAQEALSEKILLEIESGLLSLLTQTDKYKQILTNLITEAAIGLSTDKAVVNASMVELPLIDENVLCNAEKSVYAATGKTIKLEKMNADPLTRQGIYLVSGDGQLAYDNTVKARMERLKSEIRKMIYNEFFADTDDAASKPELRD